MRARLPTIAFRLLVLTAVWLLGTATFTLAQEGTTTSPPAVATTTAVPDDPQGPLVVPDVRGLPYVFAKGVLEEAGFAWKVKGKVGGYAVNIVKSQSVKPGARVVDTGAPRIVLTLAKNSSYDERGLPQSTAPYPGTRLLLASGAEPVTVEANPTEAGGYEADATVPDDIPDDASAADPAGTTTESEPEDVATEPEPSTDPAETAEVDASGAPDQQAEADDAKADEGPVAVKPKAKPKAKPEAEPTTRTRAFVVPGAPAEPLDEIPLPLRAKRLQARIAKASSLTDELIDHWRYQHAWIVAGAQFGWWHGAEALRILIKVDEALQRRWNFAFRSEERARAALAEVQRRSQ